MIWFKYIEMFNNPNCKKVGKVCFNRSNSSDNIKSISKKIYNVRSYSVSENIRKTISIEILDFFSQIRSKFVSEPLPCTRRRITNFSVTNSFLERILIGNICFL